MSREEQARAIAAFLRSIGIEVEARMLEAPTFLPGVKLEAGRVIYDPARLAWPGDLLHEAGHVAVTPAALRGSLDGAIADELVVDHAEEAVATAWAFAAVTAVGLAPSVLFHEGGYHGKSAGLILTYTNGVYPGIAGLVAAGMTVGPAQARERGVAPYPAMLKWLRD